MDKSRCQPPKCALDSNCCLTLDRILAAFNAPLNEVQAWAICYQTVKCIMKEMRKDDFTNVVLYEISELSHIRIHKEGFVHSSSITSNAGCFGSQREVVRHEEQVIEALGMVIFLALDYGLCTNEQTLISQNLEILMERMTTACTKLRTPSMISSEHPDDEGIEQDHDEDNEGSPWFPKVQQTLNLNKILDICASQLTDQAQAELHYKAVCRALVAEVIELSSFLQKVVNGTEEIRKYSLSPDKTDGLANLHFYDWSKLWIQVIKELRNGVKLKEVKYEGHPYEFELTPYEMLLDDIRLRRYRLKKVIVNRDLPSGIKRDAREVILEFIRSRPPLVPVSQRTLAPKPELPLSLHEKLMALIKQQHKLKPTNANNKTVDTSKEPKTAPSTRKRLIKVDRSLLLSLSDDEDDFPIPSTIDELGVLSLTLEEVVHIRKVLTKAELDSVILNKALYEALERGKICFTCKEVRFSLFGAWGHKCKLCERNVCAKCCNKIRIPTDQFSNIPVRMLGPVNSTPLSEPNWKGPPLVCSETIQVKPTSSVYDNLNMVNGGRRLSGPLVSVCRDCKNLVAT